MNYKSTQLLKLSFLIGTIADGFIAITWFMIASGSDIPNIMCGFKGSGPDYQYAMYIAALFMTGWTGLLYWGWLKPNERKGLLLITALLLLVSIIIEVLFYQNILGGRGFVFGVVARLLLITKFSFSYYYSIKHT
jgi:hypothetical protein